MNRRALMAAGSAIASTALLAQAPPAQAPPKTHLKVGDAAPGFKIMSINRKPLSLADYKGKGLVLAFFPAAFTGGCEAEMKGYQAGIAKFQEAGYEVIGVSTDNVPSIKHWADNVIHPTFEMASDFSTRAAAKAYGVLNAGSGTANRATFVIDSSGKIIDINESRVAIDHVTGALTACSRKGH